MCLRGCALSKSLGTALGEVIKSILGSLRRRKLTQLVHGVDQRPSAHRLRRRGVPHAVELAGQHPRRRRSAESATSSAKRRPQRDPYRQRSEQTFADAQLPFIATFFARGEKIADCRQSGVACLKNGTVRSPRDVVSARAGRRRDGRGVPLDVVDEGPGDAGRVCASPGVMWTEAVVR
jgi:hypothetical protein